MKLYCFGRIVKEEWLRTAKLRTNVEFDEYVIMPDHLHGIVILGTARRAPTRNSSLFRPLQRYLPLCALSNQPLQDGFIFWRIVVELNSGNEATTNM